VDGAALAAATVQRLMGGPPRGASTISMQLAALLDPALRRHGGPRTVEQKWRQMRLSWALEANWSKSEILEAYLNLVTFRGELQGVAAAAALLFDKTPHGLDAAESAVLAVLLRAPNVTSEILARRASSAHGGAAAAAIEGAAARAIRAPRGTGPRVTLAPHVALRLLGPPVAAAPAAVVVRSTLAAPIQRLATSALRAQLASVRAQHVQDGAVLVADNATGDVLAYVGGAGAVSSARWVDGVRAKRQAGSTLKPFLYALALDERLVTPASLVKDSPLEILVAGGLYRPHNYDERFLGLVSVRTALASSLNVPAVRTLGLVGDEAFVQRLRRLGFEGLREGGDFYGPALALGSADVSLWELVNAYRTLANSGRWSRLRLTPEETMGEQRRVYSATAAFLVSDMLADRESRSATFGLESPLSTPFWTAVKTGTSKDMRDNWCVGYSQHYTVGVWVGNFSGEPMWNVSGVTGAAPVWLEVMTYLHKARVSHVPIPPAGLIRARVDFAQAVEPTRAEWFLQGTEPVGPPRIGEHQPPRIVAPTSGTRIALDPDIPASHQRVAFEAEHVSPGLRWVLDGADIGIAISLVLWSPRSGNHRLSLVDADGRLRASSTFEVHGTGGAD
jgi:penicillin-binding protein 1C